MTGLEELSTGRSNRCLDFSLKSLRHNQNSRFFPPNPSVANQLNVRNREPYIVNFARTAQYKNSAIPYMQRQEGRAGGGGRRKKERRSRNTDYDLPVSTSIVF